MVLPESRLAGCHAKIARAREHFDELKRGAADFFEDNLARVETGEIGLDVIESPVAPPARLSLILGDMVHNLRCALDYLAWELAKANLGGTEPSRKTQFSLANSPEEFARLSQHQLRDLSRPDQETIERMQPYRAKEPHWHPLSWLKQLSNGDKHQTLHLIGGVSAHMASMDLSGGKSDLADVEGNWAWFLGEPQGNLRVMIQPVDPPGPEEEVLMFPVFHLALEDETVLSDVLDDMIPAVEGIVDAFEGRISDERHG
jgi:hypothetical protein